MGFIGILIALTIVALVAVGSFSFFGLSGTSNPKSTQTSSQNTAADAARTAQIQTVDTALKLYYSKHNSSPSSLADLLVTKELTAIPTDPITHQPPEFTIDENRGCKVSFKLSNGSETSAYCQAN